MKKLKVLTLKIKRLVIVSKVMMISIMISIKVASKKV